MRSCKLLGTDSERVPRRAARARSRWLAPKDLHCVRRTTARRWRTRRLIRRPREVDNALVDNKFHPILD